MPKQKTHKATAKRFKLTKGGKKTGKIEKRTTGQSHFNSRESGKVGRNKKSDIIVGKSFQKIIKANLVK